MKKHLFSLIFLLAGLTMMAAPIVDPSVSDASVGFGLITCMLGAPALSGILQAVGFKPLKVKVVGNGALTEMWETRAEQKFRWNTAFLGRSRDYSADVAMGNGVATLNFKQRGTDPLVYINPSYPLSASDASSVNIPYSMDRLATQPTTVKDIDQFALSIGLKQGYLEDHLGVLDEAMLRLAAFGWGPASNSANTPIIKTTGASNGATNARKRMKIADIIAAKSAMDKLKLPSTGRILVLHPDHETDLLIEDVSLFKPFSNLTEGQVPKLYGFDIYTYGDTPVYDGSFAKKALDAVAAPTTDRISSLFYHERLVVRARTPLKFYEDLAKPTTHSDVFNFGMWFKATYAAAFGIGAIVADTAA